MAGEFGSPYRAPCGGWPTRRKIFLGDCLQHKLDSEKSVQQYKNTTKLTDNTTPEARPANPALYGYPSCASPPSPPYGPIADADIAACGTGETQIEKNCYALDIVIDESRCRKIGFKNIQAKKTWHGRYGFDAVDGCTEKLGSECGQCDYEPPHYTPPSTKYLSGQWHIYIQALAYDVDWNRVPAYDEIYEDYWTSTVDRYSGIVSLSGCSRSVQNYDPDHWSEYYTGIVLPSLSIGCASPYQSYIDLEQFNNANQNWSHTESRSATSYSFTHTYKELHGGNWLTIFTFTVEVNLLSSYTAADFQSDLEELADEWPLNDDIIYPWRQDEYTTVAPLVTRDEYPYPRKPEDSGYPFISNPGLNWTDCGTWQDPEDYTGAIIGSPLPRGYGPHFSWMHETWRYCLIGDNPAHYVSHVGAWSGQTNAGDATDQYMPKAAMQWTNNYDAASLPPGAFFIYHANAQGIIQKWAEILLPRLSQNFARPCGADRYSPDETTVRCVTSIVGSSPASVYLDNSRRGAPAINTGDFCIVCGSTANDGVYQVTKIADDQFQLTQKVLDLPSEIITSETAWFGKLKWRDAPSICGRAKIRNATNTSPIKITLVEPCPWLEENQDIIISDCRGNTAANGSWEIHVIDEYNFELNGSTGNGEYNGGGYATDPRSAGSYEWNDDQPKGDYVVLSWRFDYRQIGEIARARAQFITCNNCASAENPDEIRTHQASHGMPQAVAEFSCEQGCLQFSACKPMVVCISPNLDDVFDNGNTYSFPTLTPDDRYDSRWQSQVKQVAADMTWQAPHPPCVSNAEWSYNWIEDDGTCHSDDSTTRYYRMRPLREARCSAPAGAPAPATGTTFGCYTLAELDVVTLAGGKNVCAPPNDVGFDYSGAVMLPNTPATPWGDWLRMRACVCAEGRWGLNYLQDNIVC